MSTKKPAKKIEKTESKTVSREQAEKLRTQIKAGQAEGMEDSSAAFEGCGGRW
jgi:hypothetical protein